MKSIESVYLTALYLRQELLYLDKAYQNRIASCFDFFQKLKSHLIALNNTKDFLDEVSFYVKDNKEIVSNRKNVSLQLECCKYLRNKICGHLDEKFCEMAKKWDPMSLSMLSQGVNPDIEKRWRVDIFLKALIESAINSFRIDVPTQSFFKSEIDIFYPSNYKEFVDFVRRVNEACIRLLSDIEYYISTKIEFHKDNKKLLMAIFDASQMDFGSKK